MMLNQPTTRDASSLLSTIPGLRPAIAIALALFLVATGTLAGNAYWSAATSTTASVTAASIATSATGADALSITYKQGFAPSGSAAIAAAVLVDTAPITISNTGETPLSYTVTVTGGTAAISLQLWKRGGSCNARTAAAAGATSGTLAAPPSMPANAASAVAGASIVLCARTTLTGNFADVAGVTVSPTITFTGRVGDNWNASSGTAFSQSASYNWFRVKHTYSSKCLDANGASNAVGTQMILYPCKASNRSDNQSFRFEPLGDQYRIYIGNGTGDGPVVAPASDADNSQVQLVAKTTAAGVNLSRQLWSVVAHGAAGGYQLVNLQDNSCLTMTGTADFTVFTITTCTTIMDTSNTDYRSQHFNFSEIV